MSFRKSLVRTIRLGLRGIGVAVVLVALFLIWTGVSAGGFEAAVLIFIGAIFVFAGIDIIRNPSHAIELLR